MGKWPKLQPNAPGELLQTTGSEWLPEQAALPITYEGVAYLPTPLPANIDLRGLIADTWEDHQGAVAGLAAVDQLSRTLPNPYLLSNPFRLREAQASSRIENTIASAEEIALAEADQPTLADAKEISNYVRALDHGLSSEQPLGQSLLKAMHARLLDGGVRGAEKSPGAYRKSQAYIGSESRGFEGARFVPPPAEHVQQCMDDLERFIRSASPRVPPIIRAALTHYQFETIHPFADGNGRVGRMLIMLQLCRSGLVSQPNFEISSFFDTHRDAYVDLMLAVSLEGSWLDWVRFFCRAVAHQAREASRRAGSLLELRRFYLDLVTEKRTSSLLRELVDWLFTKPAVTNPEVADRLGIRQQASQRHVDRLVELGILTEVTGQSRNRVYVCRGLLEAIGSDSPGDSGSTPTRR